MCSTIDFTTDRSLIAPNFFLLTRRLLFFFFSSCSSSISTVWYLKNRSEKKCVHSVRIIYQICQSFNDKTLDSFYSQVTIDSKRNILNPRFFKHTTTTTTFTDIKPTKKNEHIIKKLRLVKVVI